jgi:hypothetical protein
MKKSLWLLALLLCTLPASARAPQTVTAKEILTVLASDDASTGKPVIDAFKQLLAKGNQIENPTVSVDENGNTAYTLVNRHCVQFGFGNPECVGGGQLNIVLDEKATPADGQPRYRTALYDLR